MAYGVLLCAATCEVDREVSCGKSWREEIAYENMGGIGKKGVCRTRDGDRGSES